jgi:hypothetical protein
MIELRQHLQHHAIAGGEGRVLGFQFVRRELHDALKPEGVLFSSIPHGADQEGWTDGRYGVFHAPESWEAFGLAAGFAELEHYYRPSGAPPGAQPWLASVWRRG